MLKIDLHIHTKEEIHDTYVTHSAKDVITRAAKLGFKALAITNHGYVYTSRDLASFAKRKGVLLIPGAELFIGRKHVLAYGINNQDVKRIKDFDDLDRAPFVIAPHPYFKKGSCLGDLFIQHQKRFDAVEYCHFYTKHFNLNKKALEIAHRFKIPVVGNSDAHVPLQFNKTYSLVDAEQKRDDIFEAIRNFQVKVVSKPLTLFEFSTITFNAMFANFYHKRILRNKNNRVD